MFKALGWIATGIIFLIDFIASLFKNPIVKKLTLFGSFYSVIIVVVDFFLTQVTGHINFSFYQLAYWFGAIKAIQIVVTFAITSYVANHLLNFIRNT